MKRKAGEVVENVESTSENKTKVSSTKEKKIKFEKPLVNKRDKFNKTEPFGKPNQTADNSEKTNWIEFKKKKKELKEKRKAKKFTTLYDTSVQAKQICEKLRRADCTPQDRKKLCLKIHKLLETHYKKVIFTHDMSRTVQWLLKYSDIEIRKSVLTEIKSVIIPMLESKYAKNCIKILLRHGTKEMRREIISRCYGNIVNLMSHSISAPIVELIYANWATDTDKIYFKQEFYGDMYKQAKDDNIKTLSDVFKIAQDMKSATLSAVKGNLSRILNKELINSTLIQTVLWEFLTNCSPEDRSEMIVILKESVLELSKTKIGAKVAVICIWYGTNKDRKAIMKTLKENVKSVSMSESGYLVLLALVDSVDDTVLLKKIILTEIQKDLIEIASNDHGKHVILYLVARRDSHYFSPSIVEYLKEGDNNTTSKKPAEMREKELLEGVSDSFLESIVTDAATWLSNASISMITLAILKAGSGEKLQLAFKSIAQFITNVDSKTKTNETEHNAIEDPGLHMILKKLIQNDKTLQEKGETAFGEILIDRLTTETLKNWIEFNRGCFLLITLIENESESIRNDLLSKLKPISINLTHKKTAGASILCKKINDDVHKKTKTI